MIPNASGFQSMTRAAQELGLEGMETLYEQMIGSNQHDCRELFVKAYGSDRLYPELCRMESAYRRALIEEHGLPVKKGLYPLLEDLRAQQLPVALATSSKRQTADYYLSLAGLTGYFDAIIPVNRWFTANRIRRFIKGGVAFGNCARILCGDGGFFSRHPFRVCRGLDSCDDSGHQTAGR